VVYLLENGADAHINNLDGASPLHAAAGLGDVNIIELLARHGAAVNAADDEGDTPLHWAVREGKPEAAQLLIKLGASVEQVNEDGESALDLALSVDDAVMAKALTFFGTKPRGSSRMPAFVLTECSSPLEVEEVHLDKDVNMIDMAKDMRNLTVKEDDWRSVRTVSI